MDEQISAAVLWSDKTKSFLVIKPLHSSFSTHHLLPFDYDRRHGFTSTDFLTLTSVIFVPSYGHYDKKKRVAFEGPRINATACSLTPITQ